MAIGYVERLAARRAGSHRPHAPVVRISTTQLTGMTGGNRPYLDGHGPQLQNASCELTGAVMLLSEQFTICTDQFEIPNHHGDWVRGATCAS